MSSSVVNFYRGKSVLITGATGFVGKVLLEKLLRDCPEIGKIYLLIRPQAEKGASAEKRLSTLLQSRIFTFSESPLATDKVVAIAGDLTKPGLGLSPVQRKLLTEKVSVIFHSAATVKFSGPLKGFIEENALGTEAVMQLATETKPLESIVQVSTAYANCNLVEDIEEKVYPLGEISAQTVIESILASPASSQPLTIADSALLGRPNSYTVSKAVAENLVKEKYAHLPVVICRPSSVTNSVATPVAGWSDSTDGPNGLFLFACLGLLRTINMEPHLKINFIPVDYVANSLIVAGWHTATYPEERQLVVHLTMPAENCQSMSSILDHFVWANGKAPSLKQVRPFMVKPTSTRTVWGKVSHHCKVLFSHLLFAHLYDLCLSLTGQKRFMVKLTGKMNRNVGVLEPFTSHQWSFRYRNYRQMWAKLSPEEQTLFSSNPGALHWPSYCHNWQLGLRRYLLKEDDSTIKEAVKRLQTVTLITRIIQISSYLGLGSFVVVLANGSVY